VPSLSSHFSVVPARDPALSLDEAMAFVGDPQFGGFAFFVGRIRNNSGPHVCVGVDYEVHTGLAVSLMDEFFVKLDAMHPETKLYAVHAQGQLGIGDVAVVIACGARHRSEAFSACRALIEHVKHALPIWKREHFLGGVSAWAEGCALCDGPINARA
jgi:molybdopterin synthase catalytic subunit